MNVDEILPMLGGATEQMAVGSSSLDRLFH